MEFKIVTSCQKRSFNEWINYVHEQANLSRITFGKNSPGDRKRQKLNEPCQAHQEDNSAEGHR